MAKSKQETLLVLHPDADAGTDACMFIRRILPFLFFCKCYCNCSRVAPMTTVDLAHRKENEADL
jgi:hypothetical protein